MPTLLYGLEAWDVTAMEETRKIEEVYPNVVKEIIRVPSETPHCELILETGLRPAKKDFGFQN